MANRDAWPYGPAVVDGLAQYFSPSSMTSADPSGSEGCLRAWYFEKVLGKKKPQTAYQTTGVDLHAELENYALGKVTRQQLSALAASGLHMVPDPGPDLRTELDIAAPVVDPSDPVEASLLAQWRAAPDGPAREVYADYVEQRGMLPLASAVRRGEGKIGMQLAGAPLRAAGIPVLGFIDLVHQRGTNKGASEIEDTKDPDGTIEVIDYKTSGNARYIKSPREMSRTIQMTTYGKWVLRVAPTAEHVRLSHCYFITKGPGQPRKVTLRVHRDEISERWEHIERLAGSIAEAAGCQNPDDVPANTRACGAYGGCFHKPYCKAAMHNSLAALVGQTAAQALTAGAQDTMTLFGNTDTSLIDSLKSGAAPDALAAQMARLAAEEAAARKSQDPLLLQIEEIERVGLGFPTLAGDAAARVASARGIEITKGAGLAGTGDLGKFTLTAIEQFDAALAEAKAIKARRALAGSVLPSDAPASSPALASKAPGPSAEEVKLAKEREKADAKVKKDAEKAEAKSKKDAEKAAAKAVNGSGPELVPLRDEYRPPTSPELLAKSLTQVDQAAGMDVVNAPASIHLPISVVANPQGAITLYVNCKPEYHAHQSLWPVVDGLTMKMAKQFDGDDYRITDPNGKLGFGRWKGVLAAMLRETPPGPGNWTLTGATSELGAVVIEAMREICRKSGGDVVVA